jgi:hypothetical protein
MKYRAAILQPVNGAPAGHGAGAAVEFHHLNI